MFNFIRDFPIVQSFPKWLDPFGSHKQWVRVPVAPDFPPTPDVVFCIAVSLVGIFKRFHISEMVQYESGAT